MYKQIARTASLLALVAAPAFAQAADARPTLAVLPFTNSAIGQSNAELAPLSQGIADLLQIELAMNTGVRVVERANLVSLMNEQNLARDGRIDEATAARVGKLLGAKHMLTGTFITNNRGTMVLTLKSINTETGVIEWTSVQNGTTAEFLDLVTKAATAANAGLKLPAIAPQARQTTEARTEERKKVPFQAVMLYSRAIAAQDAGKRDEAIQLFDQTISRFPDFEDAKTARARLAGGGGQ